MKLPYFSERARKKAEAAALERNNNEPPLERRLVIDREQIAGSLKILHGKGASHLTEKDVKLVQDTLEEYIRDTLPSKDIQVWGLGTFKLEWRRSSKHNLNPYLILAAGYRTRFRFSGKLLKKCNLRKTVSIYEEK